MTSFLDKTRSYGQKSKFEKIHATKFFNHRISSCTSKDTITPRVSENQETQFFQEVLSCINLYIFSYIYTVKKSIVYVESYFEMRTLLLLFLTCFYVASSSSSNFEISWEEEMKNGRVRLYFAQAQEDGSCDRISEPRSSCDDTQNTTQVFGADVFEQDKSVDFNDTVLGYPLSSLSLIPPVNTVFKLIFFLILHIIVVMDMT